MHDVFVHGRPPILRVLFRWDYVISQSLVDIWPIGMRISTHNWLNQWQTSLTHYQTDFILCMTLKMKISVYWNWFLAPCSKKSRLQFWILADFDYEYLYTQLQDLQKCNKIQDLISTDCVTIKKMMAFEFLSSLHVG